MPDAIKAKIAALEAEKAEIVKTQWAAPDPTRQSQSNSAFGYIDNRNAEEIARDVKSRIAAIEAEVDVLAAKAQDYAAEKALYEKGMTYEQVEVAMGRAAIKEGLKAAKLRSKSLKKHKKTVAKKKVLVTLGEDPRTWPLPSRGVLLRWRKEAEKGGKKGLKMWQEAKKRMDKLIVYRLKKRRVMFEKLKAKAEAKRDPAKTEAEATAAAQPDAGLTAQQQQQ
jgi:hypothetical protein